MLHCCYIDVTLMLHCCYTTPSIVTVLSGVGIIVLNVFVGIETYNNSPSTKNGRNDRILRLQVNIVRYIKYLIFYPNVGANVGALMWALTPLAPKIWAAQISSNKVYLGQAPILRAAQIGADIKIFKLTFD